MSAIPPKEIRRPSFCPNCGQSLFVVRHVMSNMFEIYCSKCEYGAVVMSDDRVKLPSAS